jgi:hypothetical protein
MLFFNDGMMKFVWFMLIRESLLIRRRRQIKIIDSIEAN